MAVTVTGKLEDMSDVELVEFITRMDSEVTQTSNLRFGGSSNPWFSTKTAVLVTSLIISIFVLVSIILYLTISEEDRDLKIENSLVLNGNDNDSSNLMKIMELIPEDLAIVHLNLSNFEVDIQLLLKQLERRTELKTLSLINVTLSGILGSQDDLILPHLEQFTLELNQPIGPNEQLRLTNENCSLSNKGSDESTDAFQDKDCLRSLIFYCKDHLQRNWDIEQVHLLNTTIRITLFGLHVFVADPVESEIISSFNFTQGILEDILQTKHESPLFKLSKLYLTKIHLNMSVLSQFSDSLRGLHLSKVDLGSNTNFTVFREFNSLTMFHVLGFGFYQSGNAIINLNDITPNVNDLSFFMIDVDLKKYSDVAVKFSLDYLSFGYVLIMNDDIINQFDQIFDAKRVWWTGGIRSVNPGLRNCDLWLNIMKMQSIEYIIFEYIDICTVNSSSTVRDVLKRINVDLDISKSFVMKKDNDGVWIGRNFDKSNRKETVEIYIESGFFEFDLKVMTKEFVLATPTR